jgi:hypothetical protein
LEGRTESERINQTVTRLLASILLIYQVGELHRRRDLRPILRAAGLPASEMNVDAIALKLPVIRQENLEAGLDTATRDQLNQARDDYLVLRGFAEHLHLEIVSSQPMDQAAMNVIGMLVLRDHLGADLDSVLESINAMIAGIE